MESDDEDVGVEAVRGPYVQGLSQHVLQEVIPGMIKAHALPAGVQPVDMPVKPIMDPWDFFNNVLKKPKHIMAPMVDVSDLSYRLLSRRYNTHVTFTPMIHSKLFIKSRKNQRYNLRFDPTDRPIICQFGGATLEEFLPASLIAQEHPIDAIDVNIGCPQHCARQGAYGAFLLETPNEIYRIVRTLSQSLKVPVTVKIRILPDLQKTLEIARNIEACGAVMLTVHGRTKEQKGAKSGPCNWDAIKAIREALKIPVISNGGIQEFDDIEKCLKHTGAAAVMSADAMMWNPAFFANLTPDPCDLIIEYIGIYRNNEERTRKVLNTHIFEMLRAKFDLCPEFRKKYNLHQEFDTMIAVISQLKIEAAAKEKLLNEKAAEETVSSTGGEEQAVKQDATVIIPPAGAEEHGMKRDASAVTAGEAEEHAAKRQKVETTA